MQHNSSNKNNRNNKHKNAIKNKLHNNTNPQYTINAIQNNNKTIKQNAQ